LYITVNRDGYFPILFGNINIVRNGTPPLFCVLPSHEEQMLASIQVAQEKHCHDFSIELLDIPTVGIIYMHFIHCKSWQRFIAEATSKSSVSGGGLLAEVPLHRD
jgi:hypothetical protein